MAFIKAICALGGVAVLAGCVSNETVGRSDTSDFHYSASSLIDERDLHQSLAAASMKGTDGSGPQYSPRARQIIADYGN